MKFIVSDTINFLSKTFPKIYSSLYLEYLKQYASTYSVNKTQLRALITLKNNGAISMTALCNKLNIEKGSLTSMVDDLTKKGYVTRERDISDRRKYLITITERGEGIASDFVDKLKLSLEERLIKLTEEDKKNGAPGMVGLETAFSICYTTLVKENNISLNKLSELMSRNSANILGMNKGLISVGKDGDMVLVDLNQKVTVDREKFVSRGKNTPFHGREYYGEVKMTIKGGNVVYKA